MPAAQAEEALRSQWTLSAKAGVSAFTTTVSKAPAHYLKPALRLELSYPLTGNLEIGGELGAIVSADLNYAFESANLVFRTPLYRGDVFSLRLGWGFGLGSAPPILASDLETSALLAPTLQFSLGARWSVLDHKLHLSVEVISEQLVVVSGLLGLGVSL